MQHNNTQAKLTVLEWSKMIPRYDKHIKNYRHINTNSLSHSQLTKYCIPHVIICYCELIASNVLIWIIDNLIYIKNWNGE